MISAPQARVFDVLLECCGKPKARLAYQRHWIRFCCSRAEAINQWSDQAFNAQDERHFGAKAGDLGVSLACMLSEPLEQPADSPWNTGIDDRAAQATVRPGRIFLENQDVGG